MEMPGACRTEGALGAKRSMSIAVDSSPVNVSTAALGRTSIVTVAEEQVVLVASVQTCILDSYVVRTLAPSSYLINHVICSHKIQFRFVLDGAIDQHANGAVDRIRNHPGIESEYIS